jgi:hypothetical protein
MTISTSFRRATSTYGLIRLKHKPLRYGGYVHDAMLQIRDNQRPVRGEAHGSWFRLSVVCSRGRDVDRSALVISIYRVPFNLRIGEQVKLTHWL